ncbi:MAG TPA: GH1 family beta-glucosidase [Marmoricola sp.]
MSVASEVAQDVRAGVRPFPEDFVWGVATASYQIEGAIAEDGRRPSIWDTFSHTPGAIDNGDTGDLACDHYHRWESDLDLLADLGIPAYRFSIAWPRVMPDGVTVNVAGLDFYDRLVDGLVQRGITPLATLYHWDLPQALAEGADGGWLDRSVADRFAEYAQVVAERLGDRVAGITTLNEPWCSAYLGYAKGEHAPGRQDNALAYRAAHHLNLAHGRAVTAIRAAAPDVPVSVTLNLHQVVPGSSDPADVAAADHVDLIANRIFLDPMFRGSYPSDLMEQTAHLTDWSFVRDGDVESVRHPLEFLGVNYYNPMRVGAPTAGGSPVPGTDRAVGLPIAGPHTIMDWPIVPSGLTDLLVRVARDYAVPMMVTENGLAAHDRVVDGRVTDTDRIAYLDQHLGAVHDAIAAGADVRGYYAWTLLDNFEWAWGYDKRFGLVHVDFDTQVRTVKDSAVWFAGVAARNALG